MLTLRSMRRAMTLRVRRERKSEDCKGMSETLEYWMHNSFMSGDGPGKEANSTEASRLNLAL